MRQAGLALTIDSQRVAQAERFASGFVVCVCAMMLARRYRLGSIQVGSIQVN
jgi:hypothetical protein